MFHNKKRYSILLRAIAVCLIHAFLVSNLAWANPATCDISGTTLAAQSIFKPVRSRQIRDIGIIRYFVSCLAKTFPNFEAIPGDNINATIGKERMDLSMSFSQSTEFGKTFKLDERSHLITCKVNEATYYAYVTLSGQANLPKTTVFTKKEFERLKELGLVIHKKRTNREEEIITHEEKIDTPLSIVHGKKKDKKFLSTVLQDLAINFFTDLGAGQSFIDEATAFMRSDNVTLVPKKDSVTITIDGKEYHIPIKIEKPHASNKHINIPEGSGDEVVKILIHELSAKCGLSHAFNEELDKVYTGWLLLRRAGVFSADTLARKYSRLPKVIKIVKKMRFKNLRTVKERDWSNELVDISTEDDEVTLIKLFRRLPGYANAPLQSVKKLVERIIAEREKGPFKNLGDLQKRVKGLGPSVSMLEKYTTISSERRKLLGERRPSEIFRTIKAKTDIEKIEGGITGLIGRKLKPKHFRLQYEMYGFHLPERNVDAIFEGLDIKKGDKVLEIGPGQTVLSIVAAIMGAKVTVVESFGAYLRRYRRVYAIFKDAIKENGGELNIIEGDVTSNEVKGQLSKDSFSHVFCIDVLNEEPAKAAEATKVFLGISPDAMAIGVRDPEKKKDIADTILKVMKTDKATLYSRVVKKNSRTGLTAYMTERIEEEGLEITAQHQVDAPMYPGEKNASIYKIVPGASPAIALRLDERKNEWIQHILTLSQHRIINMAWASLWDGGYELRSNIGVFRDVKAQLRRHKIGELPINIHSPPEDVLYEEIYKLAKKHKVSFPPRSQFKLITHPGSYRDKKRKSRSYNMLIPKETLTLIRKMRKNNKRAYDQWLKHEVGHILDRVRKGRDRPESTLTHTYPINKFLACYRVFLAHGGRVPIGWRKRWKIGRNSGFAEASIRNGKKVGGKYVGIASATATTGIFKEYPNCIITGVQSGKKSGFMYLEGFRLGSHFNHREKYTVKIEDGIPVKIYNKRGKAVPFWGDKMAENVLYVDAEIRKGRLVGGSFVRSFLPDACIPKILENYPNCAVTNIVVGKKGNVRRFGIALWLPYNKGDVLTIIIENGKPVKIYNQKGKTIPFWGDKDSGNALYVGAEVINGEIKGGTFVRAFGRNLHKKDLGEYPNSIITNVGPQPSKKGILRLASITLATGLKGTYTVVLENTKPVKIYDKDGNVIPFWGDKDSGNALYVGAKIVKGEIKGGTFVRAFPSAHALSNAIDEHPDCIITNSKLDTKGTFMTRRWHAIKGHEGETGITVHFKGGKVEAVYDEKGKLIPEKLDERPVYSLYIGAKIEGGRRTGGKFVLSSPRGLPKEALKRYRDFIVTNCRLSSNGNFILFHRRWTYLGKTFEGAEDVTAVFENEKLKALYDKNGKHIPLPRTFGNTRRIYTGARIVKGERVGGKLVGEFNAIIPKKIWAKYPNAVIEIDALGKLGALAIGGEVIWNARADLENAKNIVLLRKNGKVVSGYKDRKQIYTVSDESSRNAVWVKGRIEDGKRTGGEFLGAYPTGLSEELVRAYKNFIVCNVELDSKGTYKIGHSAFIKKTFKGYENATGVTIVIKFEKLKFAYDEKGNEIFADDKEKERRRREKFETLLESGDIERLLENFGLQGAYRILLKMHDFSPSTLLNLLNEYKQKARYKKKIPRADFGIRLSFIRMRRLDFSGTFRRLDVNILADEIIRGVYADIVKDYHFLNKLLKESKNEENSLFLRSAYKIVYDYYKKTEKIKIRGINEHKFTLKFYQKIGIRFLLDKRKAILADEPGLGKTIEAIAAALNVNKGKGARKVLIVCPRSAKKHWQHEIEDKTRGPEKSVIINNAKSLHSRKMAKSVKEARFVIVNYAAIRGKNNALRQQLKKMGFDCIIVDEAHRMRNESLQTSAIRGLDAKYKFLLTGTPIVGRKISKIFNLLNWLYPELFVDKDNFASTYSKTAEGLRRFNEDIRSFLLRRLKSEVLDLPPPRYISIPVILDKKQRRLYENIEKNFEEWLREHSTADSVNKAIMLSKISKLKQAAIDVALIEHYIVFTDGKEKVIAEYTDDEIIIKGKAYKLLTDELEEGNIYLEDKKGKKYCVKNKNGTGTLKIGESLYTVTIPEKRSHSAKFERIDRLVEEIISRGEKVVIFTDYRNVVFELKKRYRKHGVNSILGGMTTNAVEREIEHFQSSNDQRVFIATIKTGGEAISLTAANNVIFVDKPWTPQEVDQAICRLHRIGQALPVNVYSLIAEDTVDEYIERVLSHGSLIFKLALQDDPSIESISDVLFEQILEELNYSRDFAGKIKSLRKVSATKTKKLKKAQITEVTDEASGMGIRLRMGNFSATLLTKENDVLNVRKLNSLLNAAAGLSDKSKDLIREFFVKRIQQEKMADVPIKKSILWLLLTAIQPQIAGLDYDGEIEVKTEVGRLVLELLLGNERISIEDLLEHIESRRMQRKTLQFLDRNNVFKALSLLGVLKKQFYYKGQLLYYDPPLHMYAFDGRIKYYDIVTVERIAPEHIIPGMKVSLDRPFESECNRYRKLTRAEEVRLAREAGRGNVAAEEALIKANMKIIIPITHKILSSIKRKVGKLATVLDGIDINELYSMGQNELYNRMPEYYHKYESMALVDFVNPLLAKTASSVINEHLKTHSIEIPDLVERDSSRPLSLSDQVAAKAGVKGEISIGKQKVLADTGLIRNALKMLEDDGFREAEIKMFFDSVDGLTTKEISERHGVSTDYVKDVIEMARKRLKMAKFFTAYVKKSARSTKPGGNPADHLVTVGENEELNKEPYTLRRYTELDDSGVSKSTVSRDVHKNLQRGYLSRDRHKYQEGYKYQLTQEGITRLELINQYKSRADKATREFVDVIVDLAFNVEPGEKALLALDNRLGREGTLRLVSNIIKELCELTEDNRFKTILQNLIIIKGHGKALAEEVKQYTEEGKDGIKVKKSNVVMLTNSANEKHCESFKEEAIITFVDDSKINMMDYYPIVEITLFTLAKALYHKGVPGYESDKLISIYESLHIEKIDKSSIIPLCIDRKACKIVLRPAEPLEYDELQHIYRSIQKFLKSA